MPIYEFKCTKCEAVSDELVKIGTEEIKCQTCGSIAKKTMNSYLAVSTNLPNGFHAK